MERSILMDDKSKEQLLEELSKVQKIRRKERSSRSYDKKITDA